MLLNKHILMNEAGVATAPGGSAPVAAQTSAPATTSAPAAPAPVTGEAKADAAGVWPSGWRETFSKGDEKRANIAARYTSPEAAFDALIQAQDKIRSGNLKEVKPFPDKGTPEEQTAWRKDNGLPESHDKYNLDGFEIDDADKPLIDGFLKQAHAKNMSNEHVKSTLDWIKQSREAQLEAQGEADRKTASEVQEVLRQEWGPEYMANKQRITNLLDTAPPGMKDKLLNARYPDGMAVFNDPNMLRFLAGLQMQIDPVSTLVGGNANQVDAVGDEIGKIEKFMSTNRKEYFRDEKMQSRYMQLLEARNKLGRKAS